MANNRVAYGLAKEQGIDTTDMSPKEVWEALGKKGITQESVSEGKIKETKDLQSKSVDELKEMANPKEYQVAVNLLKTMKDNNIKYEGWETKGLIENGEKVVRFDFANKEEQDKAVKKLIELGINKERNIYNFLDGLYFAVENRKEAEQRIDKEREKFVKQAIESGKYKGSADEIAKNIFIDSPFSIHSVARIEELVKKYLK